MNDSDPDLRPRAVLWDLDGTLADTMVCHFRAWCEVLAIEGHVVSWEVFARSFGQRNDSALGSMLGCDLTVEEAERISAQKEERFRAMVRAEGLRLLPGVASRLDASRAAGWRQGLVTSAPRANVDTMLAALGISAYFDVVITGDDVACGKPDPEPFLLAAERLQAPPSRCVVVEDSSSGIEAARRAGMPSVAVGPAHTALPATLKAATLAELAPDAFATLLTDEGVDND